MMVSKGRAKISKMLVAANPLGKFIPLKMSRLNKGL
jgi:hypothetical protein